jgi:hypothetical protein
VPLRIYDANGNQVWDTDSVAGGVIADIKIFNANQAGGTYGYPTFVGRNVIIVPILSSTRPYDFGVVPNYNPGYPQIVVSSRPSFRRFAVVVF